MIRALIGKMMNAALLFIFNLKYQISHFNIKTPLDGQGRRVFFEWTKLS
jgi:hypothetical protein